MALRGLVWVDASANRVATACTSAPLRNRRLTERRILDGRRHGKAHFACGPIASKIVVYGRREKKTIAYPRMSVRPRND